MLNPWSLQVAAREVRMALAAFQRQEEPAPAKFPTAKELIQLAHPDGGDVGLDGVHWLLMDRGAI